MGYLKFEKDKLINLEYSLNREILRSNRAGSYALTSIAGCNTRKYHGLLVCPLKQFDDEQYVLLSALDETIIQHDAEFHLGIHKYEGDMYMPKGHKYIREFNLDVVPETIYRVGGVVLSKERILVEKEQQLLIKYTLIEAKSPTKLRLHPLLAFRNIHELTHANMDANTKVRNIDNGIASKMYGGFPTLYMQLSHKNEYIHFPDWYHNIEYLNEKDRGYDYKEDLFVPGYFEFSLKKGESVIFSASTKKISTSSLKRKFSTEVSKRPEKLNFRYCLENAAEQFIVNSDKKSEVLAGFPWCGVQNRESLISLPGITLSIGRFDKCKQVLDTMSKKIKNGLLPKGNKEDENNFNSADLPLWYIYAIQQYYIHSESKEEVWKRYGKYIKNIIKVYSSNTSAIIKMDHDGLIYSDLRGVPLTWMNAYVDGKPVTDRSGKVVEINALWYNALLFALELAEKNNDKTFIKSIGDLPDKIKDSFQSVFWSEEKGYLADYVDQNFISWKVRPNQIFAVSLPYSPVEDYQSDAIVSQIKKDLLTPKGIRSLSPKDPDYKGVYFGNQHDRDLSFHQGTVWPWLFEHYCRAYLKLYKKSGLMHLRDLLENFEQTVNEHGIGTISEIYDGDPPHLPRGAISYAPSVGAVLSVLQMIDTYQSN